MYLVRANSRKSRVSRDPPARQPLSEHNGIEIKVYRVMVPPRPLENALVTDNPIWIMDLCLLTRDLSIESPPFLRSASYLVIITTALDIPAGCKLLTTFQDNAFLNIRISVAHD